MPKRPWRTRISHVMPDGGEWIWLRRMAWTASMPRSVAFALDSDWKPRIGVVILLSAA